MYSVRGNQQLRWLGFPIRTSADQCLVGNSPQLFAATHVLHRLSVPRHPPHALSSLLTSISLTSMTRLSADSSIVNSRSRPRPLLFAAGLRSRDFTLSKLNSYPSYALLKEHVDTSTADKIVVELNGFEPMTLALQRRCSPS